MAKIREIDRKDFYVMLKEYGFRSTSKTNGSHQKWKRDNGDIFVFPINNKTIHAGIVWQFLRKYGNEKSVNY